MNTLEDWVAKVFVEAKPGSKRGHGRSGAYALICCRGSTCFEAISLLNKELNENDLVLLGFEWLLSPKDMDRELNSEESQLISRLDEYPIQFRELHWYE